VEQHVKLGGLATWFHRRGGHVFDVALHGFPVGMIKSCRRYWNAEIADRVVPLPCIRFDNPMFSLSTRYDREDFTRLLVERFGVEAATVAATLSKARASSKVSVDYTQKKNVRKPPGSKPGMVVYERYETVVVNPDAELLKRLLSE
jgi:hypothetical protein